MSGALAGCGRGPVLTASWTDLSGFPFNPNNNQTMNANTTLLFTFSDVTGILQYRFGGAGAYTNLLHNDTLAVTTGQTLQFRETSSSPATKPWTVTVKNHLSSDQIVSTFSYT